MTIQEQKDPQGHEAPAIITELPQFLGDLAIDNTGITGPQFSESQPGQLPATKVEERTRVTYVDKPQG